MSDDRRADGGEHPLDVDARFADIIAHFHDGEPSRPQVLGYDEPHDDQQRATDGEGVVGTGPDPSDGSEERLRDGLTDRSRDGLPDAGPEPAPVDAADDLWPTSGSTETVAPEPVIDVTADLVEAREERMARIEAEIERAVRGADGGHYVPPEPPPIPRPDLPGRLAWGAALGGPLLLVLFAVMWDVARAPSWLVGAVVTATIAGVAYLLWGLPRTADREDPDDGAIV